MFQIRLRELREAAGYKSQQAFADAFGVAQSTVGGWEAGKREPDYVTTTRLARFLGVPISELVVPDEKKLSEKLSPRFMRRKELIERQNISYKELSEKTGISAQRLKRYFTSDSLGRIDFLDEFPKLARALGVSPQYLYCLTDDETNDKDTNQSFRDYVMEHSILRDYFKQQDVDTKKELIPEDEDEQNLNIIKIAGRDGSFVERQLTDDQLTVFKLMLSQLPDVGDL